VSRWEAHVSEHVGASSSNAASFGTLERIWSATCRHYWRAAVTSFWAKAVAMKAEITRRPCFPAWASTLCMKCTRQLPGRAEHLGHGGLDALMAVGDHQLHPGHLARACAGTRSRTAQLPRHRSPWQILELPDSGHAVAGGWIVPTSWPAPFDALLPMSGGYVAFEAKLSGVPLLAAERRK
jgi:hypothetical protein